MSIEPLLREPAVIEIHALAALAAFVVALAMLVVVSLSCPPAAAGTWYRDATGDVVGSPPETPAQLLEYCMASPAHCAISVNHLSGGWERHLSADRLNPVASTYKLLTLLAYAETVSDGRMSRMRPLPREQWSRYWIGADGDELQRALTGPVTDANGRAYQIRRAGGRRLTGALRRSWEHLGRPLRVTGYHDTPASVNAMFLAFLLNPDQPDRPASGDRVLDAYSGYEARGYRDELARWFGRLEDPRFVARARACQPAVLPWERRIGACPSSVHEPSEDRIRRLFNRYSTQSNTRTQTRLMTGLLERTLLAPGARDVAEHALEFRLDPRRFRDPKYRNRFRRHAAKSGSFQTKRGFTVLAWTAYFESQPRADGSVEKGAVSIHLRDLPGRRPDGKGGFAGSDIDLDLPLRFAEDVILDTDGLGRAVRERVPEEVARPELLTRVRRLEAVTDPSAGARRLSAEVRVRNIGTAPTKAVTDVALFLRPGADDHFDPAAETPAQGLPVPPLAPGESTETGDVASGDDVQWERLRFPAVNHRSIGTRRGNLDAGDVTIRFEGPGELPLGDRARRRARARSR